MSRARLLAALTVLVVTMLQAGAAADASPPPQASYAHMGLGHFVSVPKWAKGMHIHFFPTVASASRPESFAPAGAANGQAGRKPGGKEGESSPGGASSELGIREGEAGPLGYYNHGGYGVQHTVKIYPIFWGSNWNIEPGLAVKAEVMKMYEGLSGSNYQGILNQYFDHTSRVSKTVEVEKAYVDTTVTAPTEVQKSTIEAEVAAAIKAKGWTREARAQFVVLTAPSAKFVGTPGYCAFHWRDGFRSSYTLIPYMGDEPFAHGCLGYDKGKVVGHVEQTAASHEYAESATDPDPSSEEPPEDTATWITNYGSEIGDICASGDDELANGTWVQGEWDNYQNACSLSDASPPEAYGSTGGVIEVEAHAATFTASVYSESHESEYWFEYGLSPEYGTSSSPVKVAAGESTDSKQEVTFKATGLELNRTYHYRIVVKNSTGTFKGEDRRVGTSSWRQQSMPEFKTDKWPRMKEVSCPSPSFCMAVGNRSIPDGVGADTRNLAEKWNGSEWTVTETPEPEGAFWSFLEGVSCTSSTWCMAVGKADTPSFNGFYALYWNGTKWTAAMPATPSSGHEPELHGVSCVSSSWCVAVGDYYVINPFTEYLPLIEIWNGTSWSVQSSSMSPALGLLELFNVSCSSTTQCMAVGMATENGETSKEYEAPLVLGLSGSTWSRLTGLPANPLKNTGYDDVSCPASDFCIVGGGSWETVEGLLTLADFSLAYDGGAWREVNVNGRISDISCISVNWCEGVSGFEGQPHAQHWNGEKWVAEETLLPTSGEFVGGFDGVACADVSSCEAVGDYSYNAGSISGWPIINSKTLAEQRSYAWPTASSGLGTVTASSAEVTGSVNPASSETTYQVEYGTSTGYGSKTSAESAGSGTTSVPVTQKLTGLTPGTLYHYRLVASNGVGVTVTRDATFTTPASVALCKANESPCVEANRYASGTSVSAALKSSTTLSLKTTGGETINSCTGSSLTGKVTAAGGPSERAAIDVSSASFSGCTNTLSAEGLSWHSEIVRPEGSGNGTETFSNLSLKTVYAGVSCVYGGSAAFSVTGAAEAELATKEASLAKTSGGFFCPSTAKLTATYTLKAPAPLYLTAYPLGATVLCKTANEVCAEANRYGTGTKLSASLKKATSFTLKSTGGEVLNSCTGSSLEGKVTGAGGSNEVASADISAASFSGCSSTVSGEGFNWHSEIAWKSSTNGTQTFSNLALSAGMLGVTCNYGGKVAFSLNGGSEAELAAKEASLAKTGGSLIICPGTVKLTATYLLTAPAPLYVSRPK
jgi:hypothetical protein